jgi:hypothetical protein
MRLPPKLAGPATVQQAQRKQLDMSPKAFLSYTADDYDVVNHVASELRRADVEVFFAHRDLPGGERLRVIPEKIANADVVVVALSRAALNSRWVVYEMETAVALQLKDGRPRVVPLLLEQVALPPALVRVRAISLVNRPFHEGVSELISVVRGDHGPVKDRLAQFGDFLDDLVVLDDEACKTIENFWQTGRIAPSPNVSQDDSATWDEVRRDSAGRAREQIKSSLALAGVGEDASAQVLRSFDRDAFPPVIGRGDLARAKDWSRHFGSEDLLDLAEGLWLDTREGMGGTTEEWIVEWCRARKGKHDSDWQDESQARDLIERAHRAGLLKRTSENLPERTDPWRDAQANPSFNYGDMVWFIGKLALRFRSMRASAEEALARFPQQKDHD